MNAIQAQGKITLAEYQDLMAKDGMARNHAEDSVLLQVLEPGENVRTSGRATLQLPSGVQVGGRAALTCLRLIFWRDDGRALSAAETELLSLKVLPCGESLPLFSILAGSWVRERSKAARRRSLRVLESSGVAGSPFSIPGNVLDKAWEFTFATKDGRTVRLAVESEGSLSTVLKETIQHLLKSPASLKAPAFGLGLSPEEWLSRPERESHVAFGPAGLTSTEKMLNAWRGYDPVVEFKRLGVDVSALQGGAAASAASAAAADAPAWVLVRANESYALSANYPALLALPATCATSGVVAKAAKFRSKGRIPTLSWRCLATGASISRCAQPLRQQQIHSPCSFFSLLFFPCSLCFSLFCFKCSTCFAAWRIFMLHAFFFGGVGLCACARACPQWPKRVQGAQPQRRGAGARYLASVGQPRRRRAPPHPRLPPTPQRPGPLLLAPPPFALGHTKVLNCVGCSAARVLEKEHLGALGGEL